MKNYSKMIVVSLLCTMFFLGFATKASTGETSTGSTISYTGSLTNYLTAQEKNVTTAFSTAYAKVYSAFSKTWLNIMKSVDYQSLVCLGAIKDWSLLSQLQKDKTSLMTSFNKDFVDLENQIVALEEKQDLQEDNNLDVFDVGTTYESEKAKIKELIDAKVNLYKWLITNFETSYIAKNTEFLTTYLQYSNANKDLIRSMQNKMAKVQGVLTAFGEIETIVAKINAKITGLDDVIKKMEATKNTGVNTMNKSIQTLIDSNIKKYKKLQNLANELTQQKSYVIGQFQMDLDEYMTNNLQNRYNRSQFLALREEVNNFKYFYYTKTNQLNCANVLSTTDQSTVLLNKIAAMKVIVGSWLAKVEKEWINSSFKGQLFNGFQSVYITKFKQRYNEYLAYLKNYIKTALRNFVASLTSTTTTTTTGATTITMTPPAITTTVTFTRTFNRGEYSEEIKSLQNILTTLWFYAWAIDGIYSPATIEAVYKFQLSKWLVNKNNSKAWWWFGPATRNAINNLTK